MDEIVREDKINIQKQLWHSNVQSKMKNFGEKLEMERKS